MKRLGAVRLETERLILRPFREDDAQAMYDNWATDEGVTRYMTWSPHDSVELTGEIIRSWIQRGSEIYQWCIALKENDEAIGSFSVVGMDDEKQEMEIGYCISRKHWGKGITPEAAKAVIAFLFERADAKRLTARHDVRNPNSGKVMRKAGMRYVETQEKEMTKLGLCTLDCYAIDK